MDEIAGNPLRTWRIQENFFTTIRNKTFEWNTKSKPSKEIQERVPREMSENLFENIRERLCEQNLGATAPGKIPVRTLVQIPGRILEKKIA